MESILAIFNDTGGVAAAVIVGFYVAVIGAAIASPHFRRRLFESVRITNKVFGRSLSNLVGVTVDESLRRSDRNYRTLLRLLNEKASESRLPISADAEKEIVGLFRKGMEGSIGERISEQLSALTQRKFSEAMEAVAFNVLAETIPRLQASASTVTIRGFLNLIIGIAFAFGALYLLREAVDLLSVDQLKSINTATVVYLIGVRISLALIVTLISYFFLGLYRKSLDDAKYYQNEMTNISCVLGALQIAHVSPDSETKRIVVNALVGVDRNGGRETSDKVPAGNVSPDVVRAILDKLPSFKSA